MVDKALIGFILPCIFTKLIGFKSHFIKTFKSLNLKAGSKIHVLLHLNAGVERKFV